MDRPFCRAVFRVAAAAFLAFLASPSPARATAPGPSGVLPEAVVRAFEDGAFAVPSLPALGTSVTQSTQSDWRVPILMIGFTDLPLTFTPADFETELFDTTGAVPSGSAAEYWRWASGGRVHLAGRVVAVVNLPHDMAYYGFSYWGLRLSATPNNMYGAIRDALMQCEASVDWSEFDADHDGYVDMLWVVHAGVGGESLHDYNSFWSITSRLSAGWAYGGPYTTSDLVPGSLTQHMRIDRFSSLPEISTILPGRRCEIGVYCHEFGHALGLPDLYDTSALGGAANAGPGYWSLMSMGGSGADGVTPESPSHPGAWLMKMLGWLTMVRPTQDTTLVLGPLESGGSAIEVSFEGEAAPEHFVIENRQRLGFDRHLLSEGALLYGLDEAFAEAHWATNGVNAGGSRGLRIVEADGNDDLFVGRNHGDASDPFPGALGVTAIDENTQPNTNTLSGAPTSIALHDIELLGDSVRFSLQVRAPGWVAPEDRTEAGYAPITSLGPARAAAGDDQGSIWVAWGDSRTGLSRVLLRSRILGTWGSSEALSDPAVVSTSPSVAALPGGDLAVAWSETRSGASRIVYRARIAGTWDGPVTLATLPGDAYRPSLAADEHGTVYASWLQYRADRPTVMFMRFSYASPFGSPQALTDSTQTPDDVSVVASPDGRAFVLWLDRAQYPQTLWFARYHPDSGLSARMTLTPPPYYGQTGYSALADDVGRLHAVWFEAANGTSAIHYQRRDLDTPAWLRDTTIEVRSEYLQNAVLERDSHGVLHLAYEAIGVGTQQVRYKRWRPSYGWDARSTEISPASGGYASRPWVLPLSPGRVSVLYNGYPGTGAHFMVRQRTLDPDPVLAVPAPPAALPTGLAAWPSPLRGGQSLHLSWSGSAASGARTAEVYDVSGRRVAEVTLAPAPGGLEGVLDRGRLDGRSAGVYFARLRGGRAVARFVVLP